MWKIYKITNKTYNEDEKCYKAYIGMTSNTVEKRFQQHCFKEDSSKGFHQAIKKYGYDNWILEILEDDIKTEKEALEREEFYIYKYNTLLQNKKGYNVLQRSGGREIIDGKVKCYGPCNQRRNIEDFWKDKTQKCGLDAKCKDCKRQYKFENKERIKQYKINHREIENKNERKRRKIMANENSLLSLEQLRSRTPMKYCASCKTIETTINFTRDNYKKDGLKTYCRECCNEKADVSRSEKRNWDG